MSFQQNPSLEQDNRHAARGGIRTDWDNVSGQAVTDWEAQLLKEWMADAFGYYAIQLGHQARINPLRHNRCSERYEVALGDSYPLPSAPDDAGVRRLDVGDFSVLPFSSDTLDWVILPHTLDEHPDPHSVLREAYRVLRAEGKMIILGFNPMSLWGMQARWRRFLGQRSHRFGVYQNLQHPPMQIGRLKDWLELLNCDVVQGRYGCYTPYVKQQKYLERSLWLEKAGDRWWGVAGAVYALLVVKRVYSPTLVGLINEKKPLKNWVPKPAVHAHEPCSSVQELETKEIHAK